MIKVYTIPTKFWKTKRTNRKKAHFGTCYAILYCDINYRKMRKSIAGSLLQKWKKKNKHILCQKNPSNWRPTWIQQMKLAAISCRGNDKICTVWTPKKIHLEVRDTTEYIAVLLNPGCRLTLHVCFEKEQVVWCWSHLLQKLLWDWTEHKPHLHHTIFVWQNTRRWYLSFDNTVFWAHEVFSPIYCCESENICNVLTMTKN